MLKKVSGKGASSGPIDKFCKLTPEEIVAARKDKSVVADKVQSKLSAEKREEKRDRACEYICQFFMKLVSHTTLLHYLALILCLRLLETLVGT